MLKFKVHVEDRRLFEKLGWKSKKLFDRFATSLADLLHNNITHTIRTYLRFTRRHGWNYSYTKSLQKSFKLSKMKTPFGWRIKDSSNHPASRILEYGGVVRPKHKQYLRVPLRHTPAPFNEIPADELYLKGKRLFWKGVPYFVLKLQTFHPAYFYLTKALARTRYQVRKTFGQEFRRVAG